jgi:serine/threonine-protein kinase
MAAPENGAPGGVSSEARGEQIGRYQVITRLSRGGMAELFLGFTAGPGGFRKYVALKRILPDARDNAQFARMFLDEARITAAFNHPNIAQVYELGQQEDGLFLAMEFISGQDLDHLSAECRRRQERLPLGMSLSVMRDVCQALHYAHTFTDPSGRPSPIIHRDVAQKNIMVTYDGVVKLLDFGIAKARNSLERTRAGTVKGTAGYMSPEQVHGEPLDGRSDVFSAGVVLWELVTGERLFAAETERLEMFNVLQAPIPPPSETVEGVSEALSTVILRALDRNPGARWQSSKELARALEQVGGELLFDADQRAALMRKLFAQKMAATRALLEAADPSVGGEADAVSWQQPEALAQGLRGDTEVLEPKAPAEMKGRGKKRSLARKAPADTAPQGVDEAARRAPTTQVSAPPVEERSWGGGRGLNLLLWALVLLGIGAGVGFLVINETQGQGVGPPPEPPGPLPVYAPQLKTFPEPGQPAVTPGAALDGGTEAPGPAGAGPAVAAGKTGPGEGPEGGEKEPEDKGGKARVAQGKMTLIIHPEAEVLLGKRSLGKTPLFNTPLPVGTHLLRIVGPDGKRRQLSVPIKKGETTKLRFGLEDIPERR